MNKYATADLRKVPQSQPLPGQVQNNAGGYVFETGDWKQLERFLILGTEGGTYYVNQKELTAQNAQVVLRCAAEDPAQTAATIAQISDSGRAFRNDAAEFALALMVQAGGSAKQAAFRVMPQVIRTGRTLLEFAGLLDGLKVTWSLSRQKAFKRWYEGKSAENLAYQTIKYPTGAGYTHRDIVRLSHPHHQDNAEVNNVLAYLSGNGKHDSERLPGIVRAWEELKKTEDLNRVVALIGEHKLTWEFVPGQFQSKTDVWGALMFNLPYTALLRNLSRLSAYGLLTFGSMASSYVRDRLTNAEHIKKARVHPMALLVARRAYELGYSDKGDLKWRPVASTIEALEEAFYLAFDAIEPTGKAFLLGLDVSSSMSGKASGLPITCAEAVGVMAMAIARKEPEHEFIAFSNVPKDPKLTASMSLNEVMLKLRAINMGSTDCSAPIRYALDRRLRVDEFVTLTDNETWAGSVHPSVLLKEYRQKSGIAAKNVVVGMTSTGFSIADPKDPDSLDVVGLDPQTPMLVSRFAAGL